MTEASSFSNKKYCSCRADRSTELVTIHLRDDLRTQILYAMGKAFTCIFFNFAITLGSKSRFWLGPDYFHQGSVPSMRNNPGFSASKDGNLFVFGGAGNEGMSRALFHDAECTNQDGLILF